MSDQPSRKSRMIALSIGGALAKFIGIGTTAVMTRVLTKDDVAAYRQAWLAFGTIGPLLTLGVGQGMYYFLPGEEQRVRGRVADGVTLLALLGLLFSIFLLAGGNDILAARFSNPKVARLLLWMIPFALVTTPAGVAQSVFVAQDKVFLGSAFGVISQLFIGISTVIPLAIWQSCESALLGNIVAGVLMATVSAILMMYVLPQDSPWPTLPGMRELLWFGTPLAMSTMIGTLSRQLDKLIVGFMAPPKDFAVFSTGAIEIPLIGMVTGAVSSIMLTDMRRAIKDNNHSEAIRLFRMTSEKTSLLLFPTMFFFLIAANDFITLIYTAEYADAAAPFRWYLAVLPIRTAFFGSLMMALGMGGFLLFRSSVTLAINGLLSIWFVWLLGPEGAVVSTIATKYIWAVPISLYALSKAMKCSWTEILPFRHLFSVLLQLVPVSLVASLASYLIDNELWSLLTVSMIFAVFLAYWWNNRLYSVEHLIARVRNLAT